MPFLPLPYFLVEAAIFATWAHFYEFWDVVLAYIAPSFIGTVLFLLSGRSLLIGLQSQFTTGQLPDDRILHRGAILLGSLLLLPPLFIPRVVAILLILPVFRHISVLIFKTFLFKRMINNGFSFIRFSNGPAGGPFTFRGGFGNSTSINPEDFGHQQQQRQERDVEVVNVTPLEITHTRIHEEKTETKKGPS